MSQNRFGTRPILAVGFALLAIVVLFLWPADEPTYQGRSASDWFEEYVRRGPRAGTQPPNPAWEAMVALGSNAVPHLIRCIRTGVLEQPYTKLHPNLPKALQKHLPNPQVRRNRRFEAVRALRELGEPARAATPVLLEALKQQPDPWLQRQIVDTLLVLNVDQQSLARVILDLGSKRQHLEVIKIILQAGWRSGDVARLLGEILQSPDVELRREAIRLLESSGTDAFPALDPILRALKDSDMDVRYLAARSIEAIRTNSSQVILALQAALDDDQIIVRNVSRRALLKIAPASTASPTTDETPRN